MRFAALVAIAAIAAGATVGGLHAQSDSGDDYVVYRAVAVVTREGLPTVVPDIVVDEGPTPWIWPETLTATELTDVLIAAGWPTHLLGEAARVTWCESHWIPRVTGDHGASLGLFQIQPYAGGQHLWRLRALGYPEDPALLFDPVINARVALHIYTEAGWEPWSCARKVGLL